jgi:hypothetical protein
MGSAAVAVGCSPLEGTAASCDLRMCVLAHNVMQHVFLLWREMRCIALAEHKKLWCQKRVVCRVYACGIAG